MISITFDGRNMSISGPVHVPLSRQLQLMMSFVSLPVAVAVVELEGVGASNRGISNNTMTTHGHRIIYRYDT